MTDTCLPGLVCTRPAHPVVYVGRDEPPFVPTRCAECAEAHLALLNRQRNDLRRQVAVVEEELRRSLNALHGSPWARAAAERRPAR